MRGLLVSVNVPSTFVFPAGVSLGAALGHEVVAHVVGDSRSKGFAVNPAVPLVFRLMAGEESAVRILGGSDTPCAAVAPALADSLLDVGNNLVSGHQHVSVPSLKS